MVITIIIPNSCIETAIARLAQSVERETLSLSRSNRHDYSVHLKVVGSTPTSGLSVFFFFLLWCIHPLSCVFAAKWFFCWLYLQIENCFQSD
ncbi:hypothetical protein COCMIDRAFT_85953 [Bipolaris oryzae ATCC 44560]|uniref:Uncharacterized protein n=1 Tax=Bipolaris oryzae ATCC 44560 TaxID=930090 RepID=W6ZZ20_COCMI|nr:uncharacterized protein COCMIDRAFT_85953 [Bipolaris oryzae ATCC 44560]EUC48991.1 hypothetical protein COCMIDRAFT_85953 [Bipolaris oryzae ATCC 44560]